MNDELMEQPSDELDQATKQVQVSLQRLARITKYVEWCTKALFATLLVHFLLFQSVRSKDWSLPIIYSLAVSITLIVGAIIWLQADYDRAGKSLANLNDAKHLGELLDALALQMRGLSPVVKPTLMNLLNQVQPAHGPLLNADRRNKLYTMLRPGYKQNKMPPDSEVVCAIFKALEQVGDEDAVPYVERVAKTSKDPEVRAAAEQCLVFLRQRVEGQSVSDTLLRASNPNAVAPETLLRPTVARPDDQPTTLLRARRTQRLNRWQRPSPTRCQRPKERSEP